MVSRWFLLFGVLCIKSYSAFSPIPEENWDNEWIEYNQLLTDPSYRLPLSTQPSHYQVKLEPFFDTVPQSIPDAEPFTFNGDVAISITALQPVTEIILHCNNMTILELTVSPATDSTYNLALGEGFECVMPQSFLKINLNRALEINGIYVIRSKFKGRLQDNMRGFYRSWYIDSSNNRRWMATTQFQPGHARQAFPCYDEPGFKATFDITIVRQPDFSPTLSNMPIRSFDSNPDGSVYETFYTTMVTSTYLIAFIVSHYEVVASGNNPERPFYVYARDNADRTGDWSLEVGEELLKVMEDYTGIPYYNMASNIIMQQAAIPDFSAGAMENWGLLTYREALILYDPINSNNFYKQRVANIVSHEVVHQWFGNLVTCAWWDNLWLNEGFARFYQYYLTAMVAPKLGYETRFIVEQQQVSLLSDSSEGAHALTNPRVESPSTVSAHFSQITYGKGAAVLRMTQHLLGNDTYVKGLRKYLHRNEFGVAEPEDLFKALDDAAANDNALERYGGITVEEYMKTWTEQAGHPLLTVTVNHNSGSMTVTQRRFNIASGVSAFDSLWHIPITWTRGGAIDFEDIKPSQIMTTNSLTINRGSTGSEWVVFNKQQSGFYRVNYDSDTWSLIIEALKNDNSRLLIHEYNRAQIVDDVFSMARAGIMTYKEAFNILSFLEYEDQYAPWIAAIAGFNFSRRRLAHGTAALTELESLIRDLSAAVTSRLGFDESSEEHFMDDLQRMYVNTFLCNSGHPQCIEAGTTAFRNWKNHGTFIPANMRPWVYCTGLRHGDSSDYDYFWQKYLSETLASEQVVMLQAAGCTNDEDSLQKLLDAITIGPENFIIRAQDQSTALNSAITSNEGNTLKAFEWLKSHVDRTRHALGSINSILSTISSRLLNEEDIAEVSSWLESSRELIGDAAYEVGMNGIQTSRSNIQWYNERVAEYEDYFESRRPDDGIASTSPRPPVTIILTTTPAGSPSTASISLLTLLSILIFNLAIF